MAAPIQAPEATFPARFRLSLTQAARSEVSDRAASVAAPAGSGDAGDGNGGEAEAQDFSRQLLVTLWFPASDTEVIADLPEGPGRALRLEKLIDVRCFFDEPGAARGNAPRAAVQGGGEQAVGSRPSERRTLARNADGRFTIPAGCNRLEYAVVPVAPNSMEPSQRLLSHDREQDLWIVPGAAIFLAPTTLQDRPVLDVSPLRGVAVHHELPGASSEALRLPDPTALGRVVVAVGGFATRELSAGATHYFHHLDRPDGAAFEGMSDGMAVLEHISGIAPPPAFHIYWIGRDRASGRRLGGATYVDALIVNYWNDLADDAPVSEKTAHLAAFYHRAFVTLAGPRIPPWLSESLGQYVALHAWVASGAITEAARRAIIRASARKRPTTTVLTAYDAWAESGDDEAYRTFYLHGVGFWSALETHIERASHGDKQLDGIVMPLLTLFYRPDGRPPTRFLEVLEEGGATNARALCETWLGWPEARE